MKINERSITAYSNFRHVQNPSTSSSATQDPDPWSFSDDDDAYIVDDLVAVSYNFKIVDLMQDSLLLSL